MEPLLLTAFEQDSPDVGWYVQNDNVMGGQSEGAFSIHVSELVFSGRTNTDGGGFSSIRSQPLELDLEQQPGIQLAVAGQVILVHQLHTPATVIVFQPGQ